MEAERTRGENIKLLAVGVTREVDTSELRNIASDNIFGVFEVDFFRELLTVLDRVIQAACEETKFETQSKIASPNYMYI